MNDVELRRHHVQTFRHVLADQNLLQPLAACGKAPGRGGSLFMDETTAPALDSGRRTTKNDFFWAMACDDRGHGGHGHQFDDHVLRRRARVCCVIFVIGAL